MFKIFPGYALVEKYHNWKKAHRTEDKTVSRAIRLIIAIVAAVVLWCLPMENWIDGMTIIQKRTLAIFLFAGVRERLETSDIPKYLKGFPIALITAGILAMAFLGFQGLSF